MAFNPIASPADAGLTSGFGITFMDLLERARQQHKVGSSTTTDKVGSSTTDKVGSSTTPRPEKARGLKQGVATSQGGRSTTSPPKAVLATLPPKAVLTTLPPKAVSDKFRSRQSTTSTNDPTRRRTTVITTSSIFTTERTADATIETRETTETEKMGVVREESTVEPVSEAGMSVSVTEPVMMFYPDLMSSEIPDLLTGTTPPFLPERPRSGLVVTPEVKLTTEIPPETSTLTAGKIFTAGTAVGTTESVEEERATSTQIPLETSTAEQPATITQKLPSTETETSPTATTPRETSTRIFETTNAEMEDETTSYEDKVEATTRNPGWSWPERRPKRIRTDGGDDEQGVEGKSKDGVIHSGQYHEVNPGQYSEVHPGQYHEQNPGQYHEVNPGQYHEVNP